MDIKRVTIVLPHFYDTPIGGYKVHLQYANALAKEGIRVTVLHPATSGPHPSVIELLIVARARVRQLIGRPLIPWFSSDTEVRHKLITRLIGSRLPRQM